MIISLKEETTVLSTPEAVYKVLKAVLETEDEVDRDKEHLWVIHLTNRHTIKVLELVSLGTMTSSLVHPREVFTRAVGLRSASLIVAHNHPSGNLEPSSEDIEITKRLVQAGEILGIQLLDHLVVSLDGYTSMKQEGIVF